MRAPLLCAALAFLASSIASVSSAAVPSPANSTASNCLVACPYGDLEYIVTVRDVANLPLAGVNVQIQLCSCPNLVFCPTVMGGPACLPAVVTGADGKATFALRIGGTCPGATAAVTADGILLVNAAVRTVDLDGTLVVDGADVAIANGLVNSPGGIADFDCSGQVELMDVARVTFHRGHTCDDIIPARPASWGALKTTYR